MNNLKLTFFGGVGTATGANIMLEFDSKKILVDCGLLQGEKFTEDKNFRPFEYDPINVDLLLITHAHMDHIGKVPKLVKDGFKGRIISTNETRELAEPMLMDAMRVMRSKYDGRVLFEEKEVKDAIQLWKGHSYGEKINLFTDCFLEMQNAGHILGSAILNVSCGSGGSRKTTAFTGDLGNSPSPLLPDVEFIKEADYMVMESVYGNRNHESKEERRKRLKKAVLDGIKRGGDIVIPAFSVERTQVLLYEINNMIEDAEIPRVSVFLDSPLAIKVTGIYKKYSEGFKKSVRDEIGGGDDIFNFPNLHIVKNFPESEKIEKTSGVKIIIAGSGMSEGGRVVNHESRILNNPENTLILIGYQALGTLGRALEEKAKEVEILKDGKMKKLKVRAKIETLKGYSSHMDSDHLLEFVEKANESHKLSKVFVMMGEPKSSLFLCQRIRDHLDIDAVYPKKKKEYKL